MPTKLLKPLFVDLDRPKGLGALRISLTVVSLFNGAVLCGVGIALGCWNAAHAKFEREPIVYLGLGTFLCCCGMLFQGRRRGQAS